MAARVFPIYNIDEAVGPRQPNRADDVRVIQSIFIELARYSTNDWLQDLPPQMRTLAKTGLYDNRLQKWTVAFQKWAMEDHKLTKADGVIEPLPIAAIVNGTALEYQSTLSMMCNQLWRYDQMAYMKIGFEQDVPWYPTAWDPELANVK